MQRASGARELFLLFSMEFIDLTGPHHDLDYSSQYKSNHFQRQRKQRDAQGTTRTHCAPTMNHTHVSHFFHRPHEMEQDSNGHGAHMKVRSVTVGYNIAKMSSPCLRRTSTTSHEAVSQPVANGPNSVAAVYKLSSMTMSEGRPQAAHTWPSKLTPPPFAFR